MKSLNMISDLMMGVARKVVADAGVVNEVRQDGRHEDADVGKSWESTVKDSFLGAVDESIGTTNCRQRTLGKHREKSRLSRQISFKSRMRVFSIYVLDL